MTSAAQRSEVRSTHGAQVELVMDTTGALLQRVASSKSSLLCAPTAATATMMRLEDPMMRRQLWLACLTAVSLAACGGSSSAPAPESVSVNADAAITNTLKNGFAPGNLYFLSLSGTDKAGNSYGMSIAQSGFAGIAAGGPDAGRDIALARNGVPVARTRTEMYFSSEPFTLKRDVVRESGQARVYEKVGSLPTAAMPGAKGTLNTYTVYPSGTVNIPVGTGTTTWSIEPATDSSAWVCLTSSAPPLLPETYCYRTDISGAVTSAKVTLSINGELVSFK